jgi:hypothetical protein
MVAAARPTYGVSSHDEEPYVPPCRKFRHRKQQKLRRTKKDWRRRRGPIPPGLCRPDKGYSFAGLATACLWRRPRVNFFALTAYSKESSEPRVNPHAAAIPAGRPRLMLSSISAAGVCNRAAVRAFSMASISVRVRAEKYLHEKWHREAQPFVRTRLLNDLALFCHA